MRIGHSRLVVPRGARWDDLFLGGPRATDDFMNDREQSHSQERSAAR
jgi:antitoxin VapB